MNTTTLNETSGETAPVLIITRHFNAAPSRVFDAWTDTDIIARWIGPKGLNAIIDAHDPRVDGIYRFIMKGAESSHTTRGTFLEVDPPKRLVFTWAWEEGSYADIETLVELDFRPSGEGTELTLTQRRFTSEEMRDEHNGGWTSCLDCLEEMLAS